MRDLGVLSGALLCLLPQPANTCDFQLDFGQENATAPPSPPQIVPSEEDFFVLTITAYPCTPVRVLQIQFL